MYPTVILHFDACNAVWFYLNDPIDAQTARVNIDLTCLPIIQANRDGRVHKRAIDGFHGGIFQPIARKSGSDLIQQINVHLALHRDKYILHIVQRKGTMVRDP